MKLNASFLSICIALLFVQCKSSQFVTNPEFKIISATYYSWTGGQPNVGGINVKITLEKTTAINFDTIYFRGRKTNTEIKSTEDKTTLLGYFPKNYKNNLNLVLDKNPTKELKNTLPKKETPFPFALKKDEIVISYTYNKKTKYFKTNVTRKETKQF